ncbi:MAG: TrmB family transcriptional regulator [Candidatus Woesearchaeota archaeon]
MDSLKVLKKLGFSDYESKAYLSLCKLGPSSVKEIVIDSGLPRNKTYEALQRLENKNYVMTLPISPRKYKITNPELLKEEIKEMDNSINNLIKLIEQPINSEYKDLFWVIKGRKAIIEKLAIEDEKVKEEIFSCSELNNMIYKNMRIIKEKTKKGVKVKFITPFDKKNIAIYNAWIDAGVEIRIFDEKKFGTLLPRMTVLDKKQCRITIGIPEVKNEEEYITLWTESKAFCNMIRCQFINMWKKSIPINKYINK